MNATSTLAADQIVKVSNTRGAQIDFWIEPLGDSIPMPIGATFEIIVGHELGHEVEIELLDDSIRVHGWIKSVSSLSPSGQPRLLWELPRVQST
jgi:hypothetical protein